MSMGVFGLILVLFVLLLFVIKGGLTVLRPEAHFFLDRWIRGDKQASQEFNNPKKPNLEWRIAGFIFIAFAVIVGKAVLTAIISRLWGR
jgi:hypothetical protein